MSIIQLIINHEIDILVFNRAISYMNTSFRDILIVNIFLKINCIPRNTVVFEITVQRSVVSRIREFQISNEYSPHDTVICVLFR